jgi:hypothetical protein
MPTPDHEEQFDRFLAETLSPPAGEPDQQFVARVRQQVRLDEILRARRSGIFQRLGIELLSLVALGCGLVAMGSSSAVAGFAREVPHVALGAVILVFALWVPLVAARPVAATGAQPAK